MSEGKEEKSHAAHWIIAVVVALVLYVLSDAPVSALAMKYHESEPMANAIGWFYSPANWVCYHTPLAGPTLHYYRWWCELLGVKLFQ